MARSIGEAAALGLESGYRLGMDYQTRQRQEDRQKRLDEEAQSDRQRMRERQDQSDNLNALNEQERMLQVEGQGYVNSGTPPDPAAQQDYARRVRTLGQTKSSVLSKRTGIDVSAVQKMGEADIAKIKTGDLAGLQPGQFTRGITVATGRTPADYLRQGDKPALVEQAASDFIEGLHSKDKARMMSGLNVMFARELRTGVGEASQYGGKIVAKEIFDLHEDPRGSKDDERVIPMLRIYVDNGRGFRGPVPQGVPKGATGYYDAPLTKNRSSDPDDPVKSVGINEALGYIDNQVKLVELLNSPEGIEKLQQDQQAGDFDPNEYIQALHRVGAKTTTKVTTKDLAIPAGGSVLRTRMGPNGEVLSEERIEGREKPKTGSPGAMQQKLDAIEAQGPDGSGLLTAKEVAEKKKDLLGKETTRAPRSSGGGGSGGNGGGGKIQSTKVDSEGYVVGVFRDGSSRRLKVDGKDWKSQDMEKRIDRVAADLTKSVGGIGKSAAELRDEARKVVVGKAAPAEEPAKGGKPLLKFDKQGNQVDN